jgi:hypothetical protein
MPFRYFNLKPLNVIILFCTTVAASLPCLAANNPESDFVILANPGTTICYGTAVSIAIDNNNPFLNPLIEWRKNNLPVGVNAGFYSESGFLDGDSVSCVVTENGQQFYSNTLHFTVLGGQPKIYVSMDKNTCSYSSAANYGSFLDLGNSLDDLSFGATTIIPAGSSNSISNIINLPLIIPAHWTILVSCRGGMNLLQATMEMCAISSLLKMILPNWLLNGT